ncbi:MAG TPA: Hsp70 family protein, partial [Kofleriaceae bacterium]|nr:Hsp70 family protein [Kofleriaceae bacterium]
MSSARYIIGIDLGTTNTAVAVADTAAANPEVRGFDVAQLVAPGEIAGRRQLPSFVYLAGDHDLGPRETALPWDDTSRRAVGELARSQGARMASRMISSAKSWLCHGGVDRQAAILPWGIDSGDKLSPVAAQAAILGHVREAWDFVHRDEPGAKFADQEIIITVPASFDEAARELTLAAAREARFPAVSLLEEPQAAFYAWIDAFPAAARARALTPGDRVLVFDIGGGTTDFTLIAFGEDGETFERIAVGDHLLLGGDNIDLTLARTLEARLGKKLDALAWHALVHACRLAKEKLLSDADLAAVPITVAGKGSRLIGGQLRAELSRDELSRIVIDGFFPIIERNEMPQRARAGLQELGLPYAADPAVTRHLASFLSRHAQGRLDAVLFNGGAMTPAILRRRVRDQIAAWQPEIGPPQELESTGLDLAVARGAAYFGLARRGMGARIRGGTPRAFYVGVGDGRDGGDGGELAMCLAPKGLDDGATVELSRDFELVTNRPVSFKLFSSSSRDDRSGDLVPVGDGRAETTEDGSDLLELPPIVTVLRARGRARARVRLDVVITELGALEIWCREVDGDPDQPAGPWRLAFDMRAGGAAADETVALEASDPILAEARALIGKVFRGQSDIRPPRLIRSLENVLDMRRDEWSMTITRSLFDAAIEVESERKKSPEHESRWLNLAAFCLRPGTGAPVDDWRAKQMWRVFNEGTTHTRHEAVRLAWWIAWRRIAGGLSRGQQEQIYDRLAQLFLPSTKQKKKWSEVKPSRQEAAEMLRTLANLERLELVSKIRLGDEIVRRMETKKGREDPLHFWALGRIGS